MISKANTQLASSNGREEALSRIRIAFEKFANIPAEKLAARTQSFWLREGAPYVISLNNPVTRMLLPAALKPTYTKQDLEELNGELEELKNTMRENGINLKCVVIDNCDLRGVSSLTFHYRVQPTEAANTPS